MDNKYTNTDIFKMTECPSDALLLSYVKGKISKEDKRLVELHLVDCEMCNDMVEGYQRMNPTQISSNIEAIEISIDLAIASHQKKSIGSSSFKWYYAAAAVLIIGLTGILYNIYFTNLNSAKVADLPMPHQNEVLIDTTEKEENNNLQKNNLSEETNTKESLKTVTSEIINKEISVAEEDIALAGTAANDELPAPVEQKMEEKPMVVYDAETTTKATLDNMPFGNSTIAQPTFTATPNTEMLSNGSSPALVSPSTQLNTVDYTWDDGKKRNSDKKESAAKSKFKADKPAVAVKSEEEKDKQLERAADEKSDSISLNLLIEANQLLLQKNYNAALPKFKGYLVNKPKDCEAVNGAAQCYDATNKIADAIIYYTKLSQLKCAKQSDAAYLKLSELYIKNNQPNEAKQILQKAMQSKYLDIAEQAKKELDKL